MSVTTVKPAEAEAVPAPIAGRAVIERLFELPFNDLLYRAHGVHRANFDPNAVQLSTLLSVKTGGCPEDCAYCPQSARHAACAWNSAPNAPTTSA